VAEALALWELAGVQRACRMVSNVQSHRPAAPPGAALVFAPRKPPPDLSFEAGAIFEENAAVPLAGPVFLFTPMPLCDIVFSGWHAQQQRMT